MMSDEELEELKKFCKTHTVTEVRKTYGEKGIYNLYTYNLKTIKKTSLGDMNVFKEFCKTHTVTEIVKKYGEYARVYIYKHKIEHIYSYKKRNVAELKEFCKTHNREEIKDKFGSAGLSLMYYYKFDHKKKVRSESDKTIQIRNDYLSGMKQKDLVVKYNLTRQRIGQIVNKIKRG